jgi:hypothetical protein
MSAQVPSEQELRTLDVALKYIGLEDQLWREKGHHYLYIHADGYFIDGQERDSVQNWITSLDSEDRPSIIVLHGMNTGAEEIVQTLDSLQAARFENIAIRNIDSYAAHT